MTEDRSLRTSNEPAVGKQRKKRKWDQPAEHLVSTAASMAGVPLNIGALPSVPLPGATMYPAVPALNTVPVPYALPPQLSPLVIQNAVAAVQKLSQAKISDELIAREIVINDAEASIRYKLTKKQTQEEIQKSTGAVIITRGKYQPPNGQPDGEKPLYLHISAGCQLKDTVERIKAVDHAASMVEDILKQGQSPQATSSYSLTQGNGQVHPFSASIYLGFDADPSLNIAARIRGPNDQYINHIMNETGVTVVLRGKDSGNLDTCNAEVSQQPLHLYLSSLHVKNLEAAKVLAENLLDTIAAECGASRISSSKVYSAVPPPQQLLTGVQTSPPASDVPPSTLGSNVPSTSGSTGVPQFFVSNGRPASMGASSVTPQSRGPTYCGNPPNNTNYPKPPVNGETFYSGYGGIYPQATPLQQVALTLRHAPSLTSPVPSISMSTSTTAKPNSSSDTETDKRSQKRKFQELPVSKGPTIENQNLQQGLEFLKTGQDDLGETSSSSMPPPKKLVWHGSNGMLPPAPRDMPPPPIVSTRMPLPPPRNMPPPPTMTDKMLLPPHTVSDRMLLPPSRDTPPPPTVSERMPLPPPRNMPPPPPPPPPKFPLKEMLLRTEIRSSASRDLMAPPRSSDTSSVSLPKFWSAQLPLKEARKEKPSSTPVSDTLLKLMDYGDDEDEDDDHETDNVLRDNSLPSSGHKPFWAESFHNAALL